LIQTRKIQSKIINIPLKNGNETTDVNFILGSLKENYRLDSNVTPFFDNLFTSNLDNFKESPPSTDFVHRGDIKKYPPEITHRIRFNSVHRVYFSSLSFVRTLYCIIDNDIDCWSPNDPPDLKEYNFDSIVTCLGEWNPLAIFFAKQSNN
jgi:hypothetical protein